MRRPLDNPGSPRGRPEPIGRPWRRVRSRRPLAWAALLALLLATSPAPAAEDAGGRPSGGTEADASTARPANPDRARRPRAPGPAWLGGEPGGTRSSGLDGGWTGKACLALVLAACGALAIAARRPGPRAAAGAVRVVGRVSLSPKHSVYLLRVGQRVLVVGAGPQGPPALLTELEELPQGPPPAPRPEVES